MMIRLLMPGSVALRRFALMGACLVFLGGCGIQGRPGLDATDRKFAAFYSEYLVRTGAAEPSDSLKSLPLTSGDLDTLFARSGLDQQTFDAKLRAYSRDPALWREVLIQVRKNLRDRQ